MINLNTLTVRNLKTFASPDGGGFNATLVIDDEVIAHIFDGGFGGGVDYDWKCSEFKRTEIHNAVAALPPYEFMGYTLNHDLDGLIGTAVGNFELAKKEKAACKKGLCYRKADDEEGTFWKTSYADTPENRKMLTGKGVVEFINDKYPEVKAVDPVAVAQTKQERNACKKGLCYRKGDDGLWTTNLADTPENRAKVMSRGATEIINDKYPDIKTPTAEEQKAMMMKDLCKKGLVFVTDGLEADKSFKTNMANTPANRMAIKAKHPTAKFLNDIYC